MKKKTCSCGGNIQPGRYLADEFLINCLKCDRCDEILFTPQQTKELIKLRDANKRIEAKRKIIKVGSSIAALLPKKIKEFGVQEGMVDTVRILSSHSIEIRFDRELI